MIFLKKACDILIKKLYGKFDGKLFTYASVPGSYIALSYLLLIKKKDQIILLPANAIGDCLYVFSFLESLNNYSNRTNSQLMVYVSERYREIVKTYAFPSEKIVFLKHLGFKHLLLLMLSTSSLAPKSITFAAQRRIFAASPISYGRYIPESIVGARNKLSYALNIPVEPISYHRLPKVKVSAIDEFETKKRKICVINPYSSSMVFSEKLYQKICDKLKKNGFFVYSNVCGSQKEIEGTNPLRCSIEELYSIACDVPLVISVRSGILDYLIPSGVNMFVIYETWKDSFNMINPKIFAKHYSLKEWHSKGKVYEAYLDNECENDKILNEFDVYLKTLNLSS